MFADAALELDGLDSASRERVEALACRADIHCGLEQWAEMSLVAEKLARLAPMNPQCQITWAHAARHADSVEAARRILLQAADRMPKEAFLHYNLGCYECLLGEMDAARDRLTHAFKLDPRLRPKAKLDQDLEALHSWL
jgi:Flp pilus assembly protein TadD